MKLKSEIQSRAYHERNQIGLPEVKNVVIAIKVTMDKLDSLNVYK